MKGAGAGGSETQDVAMQAGSEQGGTEGSGGLVALGTKLFSILPETGGGDHQDQPRGGPQRLGLW